MRGLLLAVLALCAVCGSANPSGRLPNYMQDSTPQQILSELESLFGSKGINEELIKIFEALREKLQAGFPAYGIPSLDPLFIARAAIDIAANSANLEGSIENTTVAGISGYEIRDVNMNILKMSMAFDFLFPSIDISGDHYDIDGVLAVLPIYGDGAFQLSIHNLSAIGEIQMGVVNGSVQILDIPLEIDFPSLTCNMEGIMGGGEMAVIVNQMIMDLAPAIFDEIKAPLVKAVLGKFIELANSLLQGLTFQDLIDIILGNKLLS